MRGGSRTGAGRKAGVPNKATGDVKALAQEYGAEGIERLAQIMRTSENEQTVVAAVKELLDRGYGKSIAKAEIENVHRYVARLPEKAPDAETWQQQHGPAQTIQ